MACVLLHVIAMFHFRHHPIRIGDRVLSYELPGISDQDYIMGRVVGTCVLAGIPRFMIESESLTVHGQADPCRRTYFAPVSCVVSVTDHARIASDLHRVA